MWQALHDLREAGRAAHAAGLIAGTSGNLSLRLGPERVAITGTGTSLGALALGDLAIVRLADGARQSGPKPSLETKLHLMAYRTRADVACVLHCQSKSATLLGCMREPPTCLDVIPEVPAYVKKHVTVPFALPGSDALEASVGQALSDPDVLVVQLRNHGQIVVGPSIAAVLRTATFFELAAWIVTQGHALHTIEPAHAVALRQYNQPKPQA
jgi:L-fuculose-phosphate aldolase